MIYQISILILSSYTDLREEIVLLCETLDSGKALHTKYEELFLNISE